MARGASFSKEKFEEKILNELNYLLRTQISDTRTKSASLTHVELSSDYSVAKVFWDTFQLQEKEKIAKALGGMSRKLRSLLAKNTQLRHTPAIVFAYNSQFEDANHITSLINSDEGRGEEE